MVFEDTFDIESFEWRDIKAYATVELAKGAGRLKELGKAIEDWFDGRPLPMRDQIEAVVGIERKALLAAIGLDMTGRPLPEKPRKKKFNVLIKVVAREEVEVEAEDPDDAAEKAKEEFWDSPGDPLCCFERENVEMVVPERYRDDNGVVGEYN